MRQTSGAVVCPRCGRLVDVQSPTCPNCGAWRPGLFGYGTALRRWLGGGLDLAAVITGVCVVLYVASLALDPAAALHVASLFDILSPGSRALYQLGMTNGQLLSHGWWWTVLTAVFLHGSILHILFNMLIMRQYLPLVVQLYGGARAFVVFVVAGAAGFVLSDVATGSATIGASGSIFGLLAALIVYGRRSGHSYITQQLWGSAIVMFLFGFLMPSVNNWAHGGGFAAGWVAAEAMAFASDRREGLGVIALAAVLALATLAGFVLSFVNVTGMLIGR